MKLNLFLLLQLTGLFPVAVPILRIAHRKYDLIMTPVSWQTAQNYCKKTFADLATILSDSDWLRLNKEAESKALVSSVWVGLYNDIDGWRWSLNNLLMNKSLPTKWAPGQPNIGGTEACVIFGQYYKWWDAPCTWKKPFICYNANFSLTDKFIGISIHLTWTEAQTYCRAHHTDLASALNSSDHSMMVDIYNIQSDSWFGLHRDIWRWSDGTDVSELTWAPGQPDNSVGNENCAVVFNRQFSDEPCSDSHYFFCETLFLKKGQIIRMQLKSNGSLFDPAVQSFMLQKIQKNLEEKGVFNITVSWRIQPDGNILHRKEKKDEL